MQYSKLAVVALVATITTAVAGKSKRLLLATTYTVHEPTC